MTEVPEKPVPLKFILVNGFALFTMFFGAGNLIFPTQVGAVSGGNFIPAIIGFLLTSVLLPLMGVVAVTTSGHGVSGLASRIGPKFGFTFPLLVFLSIGPLYAIPRLASLSYELSFGKNNPLWIMLLYLIAFFIVSLFVTINPGKLVPRLGKVFTPVLIAPIALLCILGFFFLGSPNKTASGKYIDHAFTAGLNEGYLTMDALSALVFGIVILKAIQKTGPISRKALFRSTSLSALVAAGCLAVLYAALALVGSRTPGTFENGAQILAEASHRVFGTWGAFIFALIVIVACITTAFGLLNSCASYFTTLWPKPKYLGYLIIQSIIGIIMACVGLNRMLTFASAFLTFLYPISIILIVVTLIDTAIPGHLHWTYRIGVGASVAFALIDMFNSINIGASWTFLRFLKNLPLAADGLVWLIPSVLTALIGVGIDYMQGRLKSPRDLEPSSVA